MTITSPTPVSPLRQRMQHDMMMRRLSSLCDGLDWSKRGSQVRSMTVL